MVESSFQPGAGGVGGKETRVGGKASWVGGGRGSGEERLHRLRAGLQGLGQGGCGSTRQWMTQAGDWLCQRR